MTTPTTSLTDHPPTPVPSPTPGSATGQAGRLHAWLCEACDLVSHPYPQADVIEALASTHNALNHGGWPAARPVELAGLCESCQQRPASTALLLGLGVLPFAVCSGCLHPAGGTA